MREISTNDEVAVALQRALESKRDHDPAKWLSWLELAQIEAKTLLLSDAMVHALKGIELFERPRKNYVSYDKSYNFLLLIDVAVKLAEAGDEHRAETLLKEADDKICAVYGTGGPHYAFQMACHSIYHLRRSSIDRALPLIDLALKCPAHCLDLQSGSVIEVLTELQCSLINSNKFEEALDICNRIIDRQSDGLSVDDIRIAESLMRRAKIKEAMTLFDDALMDYRAAFEIFKLYGHDYNWLQKPSLQLLPQLLRKLEREDEAIEAESQVTDLRSPKVYDSEDSRAPAKGSSQLEQITQFKKALIFARQEAPYGVRVRAVAPFLLGLADTQEDWKLLRETAEILCVHYEHHNDALVGEKGFGCILESFSRSDPYKLLIKADLQLDNETGALTSLHRALLCIPELSYSEHLQFVGLAWACKELDLAKKIAMQAEPLLRQEFYLFHRPLLSELWTQLEEPERAAEVRKAESEVEAYTQRLRG